MNRPIVRVRGSGAVLPYRVERPSRNRVGSRQRNAHRGYVIGHGLVTLSRSPADTEVRRVFLGAR